MKFKPVCLLLGLWFGTVMTLAAQTATASDALLPARSNRHALIITVSRYANTQLPELPGARVDKQSATQIAQALQVPTENIQYLEDEQATGDGIRQALLELTQRVQEGDRVYIHFSGHGTRNPDTQAGGCVEALLAYDGAAQGTISNREMAENLNAITRKTDKLFVMIDACHSGGVVQAATSVRTRSLSEKAEPEGMLRARSAAISLECARPVNIKTRSLETETAAKGVLSQDIIHVSASRHNEISFDDERKGGLATQFMRDCMLREARDLDGSGAVSMEEIRQCAQGKIDRRLAKDPSFKAHHLVLNGNAGFVPAWFSKDAVAGSVSEKLTLTGEQALRQMFDQRDAKRQVNVNVSQDQLIIGRDALEFSVQSDRPGYVYVALAGSDNQSLYMLFPNDLDQDNQLAAGQILHLPRANWRVKASGPEGQDSLLVLVADAPRNLRALQKNRAGPFVVSLNDASGRAQLGALMTASEFGASPVCSGSSQARPKSLCSDAYGAKMVTIREVK
ncbi:MAG: caspase family protein [Rhodoferax sp.]|nr:caspase family protein [Rhodoferax sp.]